VSRIINIGRQYHAWIFALLVLWPGAAVQAQTATTDSTAADAKTELLELLRSRDRRIKSLLDGEDQAPDDAAMREKLKHIINDILDFRAMARTALDAQWTHLSAEQRDEFTELFAELIRTNSIRKLDVYRARISYDTPQHKGGTIIVPTTAEYDNKRATLEYHFHHNDGRWLVADFYLDGVSTAGSYQRSFQTILRKHGYAELIARIRNKIDEA